MWIMLLCPMLNTPSFDHRLQEARCWVLVQDFKMCSCLWWLPGHHGRWQRPCSCFQSAAQSRPSHRPQPLPAPERSLRVRRARGSCYPRRPGPVQLPSPLHTANTPCHAGHVCGGHVWSDQWVKQAARQRRKQPQATILCCRLLRCRNEKIFDWFKWGVDALLYLKWSDIW